MSRFRPALLGGVFIGVLSALPLVQAGNCCCCLWVLCGGLLSTYLLQKERAMPIEASEALLQGLVAGIVGGIIAAVLGAVFMALLGPYQRELLMKFLSNMQSSLPPESREQFDQIMRDQPEFSMQAELLRSMIFVPIAGAFSTAGAALGLAFFKKKLPPQVPQPQVPTQA